MGIAALNPSSSLARPLHTLQRWWQQLHAVSRPVLSLWAGHQGIAAQPANGAVSVLTLRRLRSSGATTAPAVWQAVPGTVQTTVSPADSALLLPAFRRPKRRQVPEHHHGDTRLNSQLVREKMSCSLPCLRVLHQPANLSRPGGLVIAGRMADVCAELDRLVSLETAH